MDSPNQGAHPLPRRRVFLPIGSVWLGILALVLELTALSSVWIGWGKVSQPFPSPHSADRIELTINEETGGGSVGTAKALLWVGLVPASFGLLLALVSLLLPRRAWGYIGLGFGLNLLFLLIAFSYPRWN